MSTPTVAELCASVPLALSPADGFSAPALEVSAVHVSELIDPTDYLSGGELLLTTGLSLPDNSIGCDRYVSRLSSAGVSALGVGLGPSLSAIPPALASACVRHELCLLVVPPDAAFLTVTKAYWAARSRSSQRELTDAIAAHRSLVDAMVSKDPVGETLKALSQAIGAWVARLDPTGSVENVFPAGRAADAMGVADRISALRVAGMHSSATFSSGDDVIAVFPLALENRVVGYLAIGAADALGATARRLVLTAGALLSLDSVQRQRADAAAQARLHAVSTLLDLGFVEPARRLASRMGLPPVDDEVQILVIGSNRVADVTEAVQAWVPAVIPGLFDTERSWFILPEIHPPLQLLARRLHAMDPRTVALMSDTVVTAAVHQARVNLFERIDHLPPGTVAGPQDHRPDPSHLSAGLARVIDHSRTDLGGTLVAYLRHRGQWDATARQIGVHRNTVRHRLNTIRALLDADPDDPDVAAELWLYLRSSGLTRSTD